MNITAHLVAPEQVMAFLDGELSAAEAGIVSAHIQQCTDCAKLVEQLRSASHSLADWKVDPVPMRLEKSIDDSIAKINSGLKIGRASLIVRSSFWTRKQWVVASGGAVAALLLVVAVSVLNTLRSSQPATAQGVSLVAPYGTGSDNFGVGYTDKLQAGKPTSDQQSKVVQGRNVAELSRLVPRIALPNRPLRGLEKYSEDSFPDDGEPTSDDIKSYAAPMIARTVSLSIVVKDFTASRPLLDGVLTRHHGYFGQLNASTPENSARTLQASLRIPASELGAALADLKSIGRVENESQAGEEVTQQHADLLARLKTSRETEQRFRAILQQRTGKLSDVLKVEEEIARVRGDIEGMEAEQKELEHRVNFATVELHLTEEYRAQLNPPAASVSTRIYNGLVDGYHNAEETVLGIVIFFAENGPMLLIWLMILVLPVIFIWRYHKSLARI